MPTVIVQKTYVTTQELRVPNNMTNREIYEIASQLEELSHKYEDSTTIHTDEGEYIDEHE